MNVYFITFRSVTLAQRGESMLRREGIDCQILRTPRWMEEQGCGYCLRLRRDEMDEVMEILRKEKVQFRRVYRQRDDENVVAL